MLCITKTTLIQNKNKLLHSLRSKNCLNMWLFNLYVVCCCKTVDIVSFVNIFLCKVFIDLVYKFSSHEVDRYTSIFLQEITVPFNIFFNWLLTLWTFEADISTRCHYSGNSKVSI